MHDTTLFMFRYIYLFVLINFASKAQNLILNGSFENCTFETSGCVTSFSGVNHWQQINSPDVFTSSCTFAQYGVPINRFGISYPVSANSYVGAICFANNGGREYIYQHLSIPLKADSIYCLSFFVSRADRITHAIKNIGAYFSVSQPTIISTPYISATPQIENNSGFISDTIGWTEIHGCFTAQGGEQYITIGNFNSNASTDTLFVGSNDPIPFADGYGYYYIDSVSLYTALTTPTRLSELGNENKFSLYPNPNKGVMTLEYDLGNTNEATMNLYDVTGKLMSTYKLQSNKGMLQMNEQTLENGIYFYHILVEGKSIKTDKIVIIK